MTKARPTHCHAATSKNVVSRANLANPRKAKENPSSPVSRDVRSPIGVCIPRSTGERLIRQNCQWRNSLQKASRNPIPGLELCVASGAAQFVKPRKVEAVFRKERLGPFLGFSHCKYSRASALPPARSTGPITHFAGERSWMVHTVQQMPRASRWPLGRCSTRQPTGVQTISSTCISFHEHGTDQSLVGPRAPHVFPDASIIVDVSKTDLHANVRTGAWRANGFTRDIGLQFHAVDSAMMPRVRPLRPPSKRRRTSSASASPTCAAAASRPRPWCRCGWSECVQFWVCTGGCTAREPWLSSPWGRRP